MKKLTNGFLFNTTHAAHNGFASVRLCSPDTDVSVVGISFASEMPAQIIFGTGKQHCNRYIDPAAIAEKQGEAGVNLIGLHIALQCVIPGVPFQEKARKRYLVSDEGPPSLPDNSTSVGRRWTPLHHS